MAQIKVMVVDDSAVVRQVVTALLDADPDIEVLCAVADPLLAMARMQSRWPDVLVLDIEMPRMDGITFLEKIMAERPTPVIICSTLTVKGTQTALAALSAGAVAIITKHTLGLKQFLNDASDDLITAVKAAAHANVKRLTPSEKNTADAILPAADHHGAMIQTIERVVAIGTSTGGTQALEEVLTALPRVSPGMVIVQHMPEKFTAEFADRLDRLCQVTVKEAQNNDRVIQGQALIAPGGKHLLLRRNGAQYFVEVIDGMLVNRHRPSVDVLFRSMAKCAGANALGVIMTGMGDDGAWAAGDAPCRRPHAGTGRSQLHGVRHAQGSRQARRGAKDGAVEGDRKGNPGAAVCDSRMIHLEPIPVGSGPGLQPLRSGDCVARRSIARHASSSRLVRVPDEPQSRAAPYRDRLLDGRDEVRGDHFCRHSPAHQRDAWVCERSKSWR